MNATLKRLALACLVLAAALGSQPGAAHAARRPAIVSLDVVPMGPSYRALTVTTVGSGIRHVIVCDPGPLVCAPGKRMSRNVWHADISAADPTAAYDYVVIADAGRRYLLAEYRTGTPADAPARS
ncbi:MAG: hypothetical protein ACXVRH_05485 [Thermoleophilaceae bacterium]